MTKPTTEERYRRATNTSDLRVRADVRSDADQLIAAGFVTSGSERLALALAVSNILANGMGGARAVAEKMAGVMVRRGLKGKGEKIGMIAAYDLSMLLLKLWHQRVCPACSGRKHPVIPGTPMLDDSIECPKCNGTGEIQLEQIFEPKQMAHAQWMEGELNLLRSIVFSEMGKRR